jgi:oligopeptide/dipeptide ABC transporter ATP-binding protein
MTPILELRNVTKVYAGGLLRRRSTVALEESYLYVGDGQPTITAIAGESGSGKTTMGMLLLGFIEPSSGDILYRGTNLANASKAELRCFRQEVQAIFQDPFEVYNPFYKVDHLLTVPIAKFGLTRDKAKQRQMMEDALVQVGLRPEDTLGRYPHQLSGGQRQRITVARALILNPQVIIADEPVSMVDASLRATILEALRHLNRELGIAILYITHDLATAYHICDNIVVLYQGTVAEAGDVDAIILDPKHPYTKLLVGSIPWPDPKRRWGDAAIIAQGDVLQQAAAGCKFAPRCRQVMDICLQSKPPLYRVGDTQAARCFLYRDAPEVLPQEIGDVLTATGR